MGLKLYKATVGKIKQNKTCWSISPKAVLGVTEAEKLRSLMHLASDGARILLIKTIVCLVKMPKNCKWETI